MIYLLCLSDTNAERVRNVIEAAKIRVLWAAPDEATVAALAPLMASRRGQLQGMPIDYYSDYRLVEPTLAGVPQVPNHESDVAWRRKNYVDLLNNYWEIPRPGETDIQMHRRLEKWYHVDFIQHWQHATETPTAIVVRPSVLSKMHEFLSFHGGVGDVHLTDGYVGAYKSCKMRTCLKQQIR